MMSEKNKVFKQEGKQSKKCKAFQSCKLKISAPTSDLQEEEEYEEENIGGKVAFGQHVLTYRRLNRYGAKYQQSILGLVTINKHQYLVPPSLYIYMYIIYTVGVLNNVQNKVESQSL